MGKQRIAIITACYNAPDALIHKHFASVDRQRSQDILHVVVDDASSDINTRAALLHHAERRSDDTVLIGRKTNGGPGAARNTAIEYLKKQKGIKYACLLDADDYFERDCLATRRSILDSEDDVIAVYGNKYNADWEMGENPLDGETELLELEKNLEEVPGWDKARLFRECYIPSCSVMFRWKPFVTEVGHFREDVRLCEDWLVWRKLSLLGRFKKLDMAIYTQTMHGSNLTTNPEVLQNHLADMVTTKADLDAWMNQRMDKITL